MAEVELQNVSKRFGDTLAVDDVSFVAEDGSFVVLLGPTGVGKTTTLRLIAGLETPEAGDVRIGGRSVLNETPAARNIAMVFQQYSLYPHLSVRENLAFPLRSPLLRTPEEAIEQRVGEVAEKLSISHKLDNSATALSGGEMQRVSIGRALVRDPVAYLMDEPLSSLDAKLRGDLRVELKRIQSELGATLIYVTHDQIEAMTMATHVGVLHDGRLEQFGSPRDIYDDPHSEYVASRLGSPKINLLPADVFEGPHLGERIGLRPEHIEIGAGAPATVTRIEHLGDQNRLHLDVKGHAVTTLSAPGRVHSVGEALHIQPKNPLYFDRGGQRVRGAAPIQSSARAAAESEPQAHQSQSQENQMAQFINAKENLVTEAIDGLLATSGGKLLRLDGFPHIKVVFRADWDKSKVALISGGGSGHEPAHAGFVGRGMLTAAICGEVFASPSVEAALAGILAVTGDAGCLLIVKNYTGDRLNFGLAAERARALGRKVEMVVVDDDIALPDLPQARGVAGTLFAHKIAGAAAEAGKSLEEVATIARGVIGRMASIGMSIDTCTIPGSPKEARIPEGSAELGLGIHGEAGVEQVPFTDANTAIAMVIDKLRPHRGQGETVAILNNLGSATPLEMGVLAHEMAVAGLAHRVIGPAPLMTSLDMHGFSVSILDAASDEVAALNAPTEAPAWPGVNSVAPIAPVGLPDGLSPIEPIPSAHPRNREVIEAICNLLITAEAALNELDAKAGDGDTGSTLAMAARSLQARLNMMPLADLTQFFPALGNEVSQTMGGSSGVILAIFFNATGDACARGGTIPQALTAGLERVSQVGGAQMGDRTMIDALQPALAALPGGLAAAAAAARDGANATASMRKAKAGRSAYVPEASLAGNNDPGAEAVALVFEGLASAVR